MNKKIKLILIGNGIGFVLVALLTILFLIMSPSGHKVKIPKTKINQKSEQTRLESMVKPGEMKSAEVEIAEKKVKELNDTKGKTALNETNEKPSILSEPLEYQLATINKGGYVSKNDITVTRFRYLIESLDKKCINTKKDIADVVVQAQNTLR
jgi:hypothetical protein